MRVKILVLEVWISWTWRGLEEDWPKGAAQGPGMQWNLALAMAQGLEKA